MRAVISNIVDYQIFQQFQGYANITVKGEVVDWSPEEDLGVYVQILREFDRSWATPWIAAQMTGKNFSASVDGVTTGGLYQLQVKLSPKSNAECEINGDVRRHLGVGDLWLVAGQSNAVGYGKTPAIIPSDVYVHRFDPENGWHDATDSNDAEGFCTGASFLGSFGGVLTHELRYPIGMVQTALGGTGIKTWLSGHSGYERMLAAVQEVGGCVRGLLWYQGCNDTNLREDALHYLEHFSTMIRDIRHSLSAPKLPVFTVQLNKHLIESCEGFAENWALLKEAQRQAALRIPNVYVMSSSDLGLSDWVHNNASGNQTLGMRLAWLALEKAYKLPYMGSCPQLISARCDDGEITLRFGPVYQCLVDCSASLTESDFLFEDHDGRVPLSSGEMCGEYLRVRSAREIRGTLLCSFAPFNRNSGLLPFDRATAMPPLSFYRVEVEQTSKGVFQPCNRESR